MTASEFILDKLVRYGSLTINDLHSMGFFKDRSRKLIEKVVARHKDEELITGHAWRGTEWLYYLTARGARLRGIPDAKYVKRPGQQVIVESRMMLHFCELRQPRQPRLSAEEFAEQFPELDVPGVCRTRNYLDFSDPSQVRIGILVPDYGRSTKNVARKVRREFAKRVGAALKEEARSAQNLEWGRVFEEREAQFTVVTPFQRKAGRIANALRSETYRIVIVVEPALSDLILQRGAK